MWWNFSRWLRQVISGPIALVALLIFVLFVIFVLPNQSSRGETGESEAAGIPDLSFYYSPEEIYSWAEAYGLSGRQDYILARFRFDVIWPLVYTFFLTSNITWLYKRGFPADSRWQYGNLAPVAGMLLDFLENLSTSLIMYRYPLRTPIIDLLAPLFTMFKWIMVGGSMILLFMGLIAVFNQAFRK